MKTIGISSARSWRYHKPSNIEQPVKLNRMYFFKGGSAYLHCPNESIRLNYKHKDFWLKTTEREIQISIYPRSLKNSKIVEWISSWANERDSIITPGKAIVSVGQTSKIQLPEEHKPIELVYFILNSDSQAVKIGRTKDIDKRQRSLQVANPIKLVLLKTIQVDSSKKAKARELELHSQFQHLRIRGEWFEYSRELEAFINNL